MINSKDLRRISAKQSNQSRQQRDQFQQIMEMLESIRRTQLLELWFGRTIVYLRDPSVSSLSNEMRSRINHLIYSVKEELRSHNWQQKETLSSHTWRQGESLSSHQWQQREALRSFAWQLQDLLRQRNIQVEAFDSIASELGERPADAVEVQVPASLKEVEQKFASHTEKLEGILAKLDQQFSGAIKEIDDKMENFLTQLKAVETPVAKLERRVRWLQWGMVAMILLLIVGGFFHFKQQEANQLETQRLLQTLIDQQGNIGNTVIDIYGRVESLGEGQENILGNQGKLETHLFNVSGQLTTTRNQVVREVGRDGESTRSLILPDSLKTGN